jgi:transcriptional regulator with XRE-family HTH domain
MPRMDKLEKLACFFNVHTSYFIETEEPLALDDISYALYEEMRPLTRANQEKLLEMAKFFRQQQEKERE